VSSFKVLIVGCTEDYSYKVDSVCLLLSVQKPMVVTVLRNDQEVRVSLTPNTWSGRGLLG